MTETRTADPAAEEQEARTEEPEAAEESEAAEALEAAGGSEAAEEPRQTGASDEPPRREEKDAAEPSRGLFADPLVRVALAVTVIAAGVCAWFGYSYRTASGDGSLAYAAERDKVLAAADQAIVNLNTLDYRDVDAGLKVWRDSSTAQLYDEIVQGGARLKSDIQKAKTTSTAKIRESALTELDIRAGKAAVIAAVSISISGADGKPVNNLRRFTGQLTRTSAGWKLSALGQAPTGTS
ncbi:hypothetical protein [Actinomadura madurae]|uniref:hypothetical protein n=1 Tax=Actinomadura madurae TaxID=1993 RepID=UPI002026A1C8|nr:hypothetical protein [Actinomadura madurae]MCP9953737.1 hypothetical protein [Actinomadura madurae]MCP9970490.1 hypothetical protein [Actinomadura madurae]MCP9982972.1 hypothetical protein [Actinomadura madurae]MCQ0005478.1 hypothetical protein [Actinomadura madurae]MCQ0019206.1 hypothetical protein [Actinomadura madurae]